MKPDAGEQHVAAKFGEIPERFERVTCLQAWHESVGEWTHSDEGRQRMVASNTVTMLHEVGGDRAEIGGIDVGARGMEHTIVVNVVGDGRVVEPVAHGPH